VDIVDKTGFAPQTMGHKYVDTVQVMSAARLP